jgi:hypothetical protein
MGMEGFELSHVTPGADVVSLRVVVAAVALVTLVVSRMPPDTTARIPAVASSLEVRLTPFTLPPLFGPPTAGPSGLAPCDLSLRYCQNSVKLVTALLHERPSGAGPFGPAPNEHTLYFSNAARG